MNSKKKKFVLIGFVIGLLYGVWHIIYAYTKAFGMPGPYELGLQFLIVVFWGVLGTAVGFIVCSIIDLLKRKSRV
jgi:hypothetical protein